MPDTKRIKNHQQTAAELLQRYAANTSALEVQREALLRRYLYQWIAFHDGQVVAADQDIERVLDTVQQQGILDVAVIDYLTDQPDPVTFPG